MVLLPIMILLVTNTLLVIMLRRQQNILSKTARDRQPSKSATEGDLKKVWFSFEYTVPSIFSAKLSEHIGSEKQCSDRFVLPAFCNVFDMRQFWKLNSFAVPLH